MENHAFVSILILTHNAPELVKITLDSLRAKTDGVHYEVVVVDNASEQETVELVKGYRDTGQIETLILSDCNTLFAEGNNIAARAASDQATHFCLLNSDIEIKRDDWLSHLLSVHSGGISAFGMVDNPLRVDGYCLLIDAKLYQEHQLDESHQWWWSVTKLQAKLLTLGHVVQGYFEHSAHLTHFGGGSGNAFKSAQGMNVTYKEVSGWFGGQKPIILDPPDVQRRRKIAKLKRFPRRILRKLRLI